MNQVEIQANIQKAQQLVADLDLGQRHAIVVEHQAEVTALAVAALIAGGQGQAVNVRLICETLFALGYLAGKEDRIDLSVFDEVSPGNI
jgi:hypothetical protein